MPEGWWSHEAHTGAWCVAQTCRSAWLLGRGRIIWVKSWIREAQTGAQEHRLALAGLRTAGTAGWGKICTHTHGQSHPSCKPHLPPRSCKPQGDEEQVAGGCSEPVVPNPNPVFLDTGQYDRRCFNPEAGRCGISQPCSDSTLYFGNRQILSVAPMVLRALSQALPTRLLCRVKDRARAARAGQHMQAGNSPFQSIIFTPAPWH